MPTDPVSIERCQLEVGAEAALLDLVPQGILGAEVVVDQALGHTRLARHQAGGRVGQATLDEETLRRVEDGGPGGLGISLAAGAGGGLCGLGAHDGGL